MMYEYAEKSRFGHPRTEDFLAVVEPQVERYHPLHPQRVRQRILVRLHQQNSLINQIGQGLPF